MPDGLVGGPVPARACRVGAHPPPALGHSEGQGHTLPARNLVTQERIGRGRIPPEDSNVTPPKPLAPVGSLAPGPQGRHRSLNKGYSSATESPPPACVHACAPHAPPTAGALLPQGADHTGRPA